MMKHDNSNQNPWAGLSSYEDPAKSEQKLKFCGRDYETKEVARLIDDNFFVTLYGKSGIGKTSLLNAGVFPALRREQYTPLSLRLGMTEETSSFQDVITLAIERAIEERGGSVHIFNVMNEPAEQDATDYLWRWFARRRFLSANRQITFPVLIFDQFEEVFRYKDSRKKTKVLLEQLNYLIDESHAIGDYVVDGVEYKYDFNFRFVLSIREDDLYRLEDALDDCSLPALKRCRYRLRSLSEICARDVILIPGEGLFSNDEKDQIAQTIIWIASNKEDNSISTNLLSLVCNRLYVESQKAGSSIIRLSLVDSFVKDNPFERFYNEATRGFSNKEKSYIEEHLVDSTGRRNSIPESDFLLHIKNGTKLIKGKNRILQRVSTSSDGINYRLELIHDSFCEPLTIQKEKREKRKLKIRMGIMAICSLCVIGIGAFVWHQNVLLNKREWKMMENQSRAISEKASFLVDNGNSYLACLLALEMLSNDSLNRPYTVEAERLLRDSQLKETAIVKSEGHDIKFSPDGMRFIHGLYIWDIKSCSRILKILSEWSKEIIHQWHPSGKYYLSSKGNTIELHSSYSGKCVMKYIGHKKDVSRAAFSPKGDVMVSGSKDNSIKIWKTNNGECIKTIKHNMTNVVHFDFLRDGEKFVSISRDSTITVWDAKSFRIQKVIKTDIEPSYGCISLSPNKDVIALAQPYLSNVYFMDVKKGTLECKMKTNASIKSIVFSKDGKSLIIGGYNGIDVYDVSKQVGTNICKTRSIERISLSPNGRHLLAKTFNDDILQLIDLKPDRGNYMLPYTDSTHFHGFFCTPDRKLVGATDRNGHLYLWNLFSRKLQKRINIGKSLFGNFLHSAKVNPVDNIAVILSPNNTAKLINLESSNIILNFEGQIDDSMFLRFCNNGKYVVGANWRGTKIWDSKTGKLKCNYTRSNTTYYTDILVPKRDLLVSVENDSIICLANIVTNVVEKALKGHSKKIHRIASSSNGNYIASMSVDSILCIWDIKNGKRLHSMRDIDSDRELIVFSDDESKIASQCLDNSILVWDVKSGKIISKLVGHLNDILRVNGICFSPNGKYLLSSSKDETIRLWDVSSGGCLKVFKAGKNMDSAFFTSDGKRIIYHGEDGWMVDEFLVIPLDDLIKMTRKRFANRKLTEEEKMQYYLN